MKHKNHYGEIVIRDNRVYLKKWVEIETDITNVHNFFKEASEYAKLSPEEKEKYNPDSI